MEAALPKRYLRRKYSPRPETGPVRRESRRYSCGYLGEVLGEAKQAAAVVAIWLMQS
nr:MAG TPA: hypothetical protein [Caudoviricetes sp.]